LLIFKSIRHRDAAEAGVAIQKKQWLYRLDSFSTLVMRMVEPQSMTSARPHHPKIRKKREGLQSGAAFPMWIARK